MIHQSSFAVLRVLLVTTNYWPEPTGIALYTTDLAESLSAAGHQVTVLTSLPHYPWWKVPSEFANLTEGVAQHESVEVVRVKHLIPAKMNALVRIRFESSLWWNLRRVSKRLLRNDFDAVIACIPTVAAGVVGNRIAKRLGIPFGLIIQDLSGAGAKQSGLRGGA
ncbi:glycosyltransferase WbuB, partial [bacterium]|nr:glycosyltransferase WbuB [bacterium]